MKDAGIQIDKYYLYPGKIFSSKQPHLVDTILGSCVAVFLWDPVLQFGSINHFMLPFGDKQKPSFKYGDAATVEVISKMLFMGSEKKNLKAKIFGGSDINHSNGIFNIGKRNIVIAREILKAEDIPIISYSIGGFLGRKVTFNTSNGVVLISYTRGDVHQVDQQNNNQNFNLNKHE